MTLILSSRLNSFFALFFRVNGIVLGGFTIGFASLSSRILYSVDKHPNPSKTSLKFSRISSFVADLFKPYSLEIKLSSKQVFNPNLGLLCF